MTRFITLLCLCTAPVMAQDPQCMPREKMLSQLAIRYSEARQFIGLNSKGMVMELFGSWVRTWTITMTRPDGLMCIMDSGKGFETLAEMPGLPM